MTVQSRLMAVRKDTGMTQVNFAKSMQISRAAYINYERGDRELPSTFVVRLHSELCIDPTWLLTGLGFKNPEQKGAMMEAAFRTAHDYILSTGRNKDPEGFARLVLWLAEYFEHGGTAEFANNMLEMKV